MATKIDDILFSPIHPESDKRALLEAFERDTIKPAIDRAIDRATAQQEQYLQEYQNAINTQALLAAKPLVGLPQEASLAQGLQGLGQLGQLAQQNAEGMLGQGLGQYFGNRTGDAATLPRGWQRPLTFEESIRLLESLNIQ